MNMRKKTRVKMSKPTTHRVSLSLNLVVLVSFIVDIVVPQVSLPALGHQILDYDKSIASTSFGEPVFRLQPPNVIRYSNRQGTTLVCLASGSPRPIITWFTSQSGLDVNQLSSLSGDNLLNDLNSRPVTNITNIRLILQDGAALRLLPFKASLYRQDVHTAEYRCVASNQVATIHSKSVSVQAVIKRGQEDDDGAPAGAAAVLPTPAAATTTTGGGGGARQEEMEAIRVADEFVRLKAGVVLKCKLQSSLAGADLQRGDLSWQPADSGGNQPTSTTNNHPRPYAFEWLTSDGLQVNPSEPLAKANKLVAFETGELHLNGVEMSDLRRTYGCRLRNATTRRLVASSNMARLILFEENQQPAPIQVMHTVDQVVVTDSGQIDERTGQADSARHNRFAAHNAHWPRLPATNHRHPQQESAQLVVLPCAVQQHPSSSSSSSSGTSRSEAGQWFYQPALGLRGRGPEKGHELDVMGQSAASRPITLEQLASFNAQWLELLNVGEASMANLSSLASASQSRILVGASFLALERPRRQLSGRYLFRVPSEDNSEDELPMKTVCDINVIVRQPLRLQIRQVFDSAGGGDNTMSATSSPVSSALGASESPASAATTGIGQWFASWFVKSAGHEEQQELRRFTRGAMPISDYQTSEQTPSDNMHRIRISGAGRVPQTPIVRIGDRLELDCLAHGHPVESIRWFRQGQAVNVQSSSDFQTELTTHEEPAAFGSADNATAGGLSAGTTHSIAATLASRLLIRQLQSRDFGLQIFECFVHNSLGDRARASLAIYVAEREQLAAASGGCPPLLADQVAPQNGGADSAAVDKDVETLSLDGADLRRHPQPTNEAGDASQTAADYDDNQRALFKRRNPFRWALVLEGEPVELQCPGAGEHHQIDWFKWAPTNKNVNVNVEPAEGVGDLVSWLEQWRRQTKSEPDADAANDDDWAQRRRQHHQSAANGGGGGGVQRTGLTTGAAAARQLVASQFGQLFGGDSRFVINGSSLQIRSPSKRHDETLFVCQRRAQRHSKAANGGGAAAAAAASQKQPHAAVHQSSMLAVARLRSAAEAPLGGQYRNGRRRADCLESLFSLAAADELGAGATGQTAAMQAGPPELQQLQQLRPGNEGGQLEHQALVSSISIRIVAKPKIDPFEFSRNLEEGMRTVVVCTVVSGQSLVDINWFKDGELLVQDDKGSSGISVDYANGFSSSLTFHRIRPGHSGQYSCIASNALAAAEHTSKLLVNVAPYFVEPPKSQRAYLNSNVLINCRADGQPSPQIRWRKLVPVGGTLAPTAASDKGRAEAVAPLGGGDANARNYYVGSPTIGDGYDIVMAAQQMALANTNLMPNQAAAQQAAAAAAAPTSTAAKQQEFRIITSNAHVQILENGSMIIREVELGDAARYSCQASNGVQPILSEAIDLEVLSPASFEVTFETITVKRDSVVRLNCAPRGDQPMTISWFKEGLRLARATPVGGTGASLASPSLSNSGQPMTKSSADEGGGGGEQQRAEQLATGSISGGKYNELLHILNHQAAMRGRSDGSQSSSGQEFALNRNLSSTTTTTSRHHQLVMVSAAAAAQEQRPINQSDQHYRLHESLFGGPRAGGVKDPMANNEQQQRPTMAPTGAGPIVASELIISAADRSDSGLFVCQASNPYGKDELTYRLTVQEPPDAPFNLQVQSVLSSSLKLLWQTPFDGNAAISYFVVEYRKLAQNPQVASGFKSSVAAAALLSPRQSASVSSSSDWTRIIVNSMTAAQQAPTGALSPPAVAAAAPVQAPINTLVLKQLTPKSAYQIRVAAVNALGQGLFAPIQLVSTAEDAPQTRPGELRAQPIGSSAIKLSWRGPVPQAQDEAPIRGYYISHRRHSSSDSAGGAGGGGADVKQVVVGPNGAADQSTVLDTQASPGWLATVSISSSNYSSSTQAGADTSQANLAPTSANNEPPNPDAAIKPARATQKLVLYEFVVMMLDRSTRYDIRVQPFNTMGLGPAAEVTAQTLSFDRPNQPVLRLVEARKQSLELKWSVPGHHVQQAPIGAGVPLKDPTAAAAAAAATHSQPDSELLGFLLYYKCEFDDWREIQLSLIFHYVIENLRCGNKYQIFLSAYNSVGRNPSDVMSVRTEGTVPLAPDKSVFFRLNITQVTLDMSAWSSGGCPISSFTIQYKRLHDKNWFILSEGATPFQRADKIIVPDLTPATWYKLLVTAKNEAGATDAEYIFGTLTPEGQQLAPPNYLVDQVQQHQRQPIRSINSMLSSLFQFLFGPGTGGVGGGGGGGMSTGQQDNSQLLFPLSCIMLLLVTSLAAYLYYNTSRTKHNKPTPGRKGQTRAGRHSHKSCLQNGHQSISVDQSSSSEHTMQLLDRHLMRANSHSCLEGTADSTTSSNSSAGGGGGGGGGNPHQASILSQTLTLRHHGNHQRQNRHKQFQSMLLSNSASKSQLLQPAQDDQHSNLGYYQHQQVHALLEGASPGVQDSIASGGGDQQLDTGLDRGGGVLTNYVLDSFLNQQQAVTTSHVLGAGSNLAHCNHLARQQPPPANIETSCRPATMKLFAASHQQSSRSNSYFEGAASSSLSSSGLGGSSTTHTSTGGAGAGTIHHGGDTFGNSLHLIQELQQQQPDFLRHQRLAQPNGFDLDCGQILDEVQRFNSASAADLGQRPAQANYVDLIQQQQQQQHQAVENREDNPALQHYHFDGAPHQPQGCRDASLAGHCQTLRPMASSSFTSAADLLQRQQQQQQPPPANHQAGACQEPIYQRLDRFKDYVAGLPACATLNPQLAYKMKQHLIGRGQALASFKAGGSRELHQETATSGQQQQQQEFSSVLPANVPGGALDEYQVPTGALANQQSACHENHYNGNCQ